MAHISKMCVIDLGSRVQLRLLPIVWNMDGSPQHGLLNSQNIGRRALFSYRARYDVTEFSNFRT